jgi:putative oxidoreductase
MSTDVLPSSQRHVHPDADVGATRAAAYLAPLGRLFFTLIFLQAVPMHFTSQGIAYAAQAGVPLADVLVPLSGILALVGGLSVLFGYRARLGALLLVLFLVPVTLAMHAFWAVPTTELARLQMAMFMKNLSLLGGALLIAYFGAGPISIDAQRGRY